MSARTYPRGERAAAGPAARTSSGARSSVVLAPTTADLAAARAEMTGRVAVVMTMGALHQGHADLLRAARAAGDHVIVTIFVNPLQFGPSEDFGRYPRTLDDDLAICRAEKVDVVFAPAPSDMYPAGQPLVRVAPGPLATILEGAYRPGHFDGVLTAVLKLLNLTRADLAFFGEKDYQQLTLVRTMVADLNVPVEIIGVPTRREPDGLALSSRNRYLSPKQRRAAASIPRGLRAAQVVAAEGGDATAVVSAARDVLAGEVDIATDYVELTDPRLGPVLDRGPARLLVAARVGNTRLIDNIALEFACSPVPC